MSFRNLLQLASPTLVSSSRFFSTYTYTHPYYVWASQQLLKPSTAPRIRIAQFDLAGTLVDPYCIAPYHAFFELFKGYGFILNTTQITGPMGLKKIEHIKHLLMEIREAWKKKYNKYPDELDAELLHEQFNWLLHQSISQYTHLTPYSALSLNFILNHQLRFGVTSGYARQAADLAMASLIKKFIPEVSTTSDEVEAGTRSAMIAANNRKLGLKTEDHDKVIFFTDASSDIRNVRASLFQPWIIGIAGYSTHMGMVSHTQAKQLKKTEQQEKRKKTRELLLESGAHCVIEDLAEAPLAIVSANHYLSEGKKPEQVKTLHLAYPPLDTEKRPCLQHRLTR